MAERDSGPEAARSGVVEDIKGKAKEVIGEVTGRDEMREEGEAQQEKARREREVAEKEAAAEKARGEASTAEARQRMHQEDES